jgi:hypothetical protein
MAFDFKKLKDLFIETNGVSNPQPTEPVIPQAQIKSEPVIVPEASAASKSELDAKIVDSLLSAMEQKNLPGEDYLEFMQALKAMQNIPLDDAMKVQTVMATLSIKGLTVTKIKESAGYYKKVLKDEENEFNTELNNQIEKTVKSKEKSIDALKETIKLKSEQIANLTKEINEAQQNINTTANQIKAAEIKIKATQENFSKAYNFVINQIDETINKIK